MKGRSHWLSFVMVAIAQFMVVLDVAITNVALPHIKQELGFSPSSLQWVVTAYVLCFGGFLLLGGRTADLFGRRRSLLVGMGAFTLFSLLIGLSQTPEQLIVLRALQGLSAAFMSPAALSIVLVMFKEGVERNKALGYWALIATGGVAIGLLLGGIITQYLGWRWNFFINVPVGALMLMLIRAHVPTFAPAENRIGLDVVGAALVTLSLIGQVLAFSQAPQWGWLDGKTLGVLAAALVLLAAFLVNESKAKHPLMPLSILKVRNVLGANMVMAPLYASMLGTFFLMTLYIQNTLHFSPMLAGLAMLPFPVVIGIISTHIPKLVAKVGYRQFLITGPLIIAVALLWQTQTPLDGTYWFSLLPTILVMPIGVGITMMPLVAAATSGVMPQQAGLASGLITTSQQMGGALGLAILSGVAASAAAAASSQGQALASLHGQHVAYMVDAVFMLLAAVVAAVVIRQRVSAAQPAMVPLHD